MNPTSEKERHAAHDEREREKVKKDEQPEIRESFCVQKLVANR